MLVPSELGYISQVNDVLEVVGTDNSIIMFKNQSTNPNPPEQGKIKLFSKTDNNLYMINHLGNEVQITKDANTFKDIWTFTTSSVGTGEFSITATEIIIHQNNKDGSNRKLTLDLLNNDDVIYLNDGTNAKMFKVSGIPTVTNDILRACQSPF